MRFLLRTLGCKSNTYDSQMLAAALLRRGLLYSKKGESPDLCIVNSCTVTQNAHKQSLKMAEKLQRDFPQALVVVLGCAVDVAKDFEGVDSKIRFLQTEKSADKNAMAKTGKTEALLRALQPVLKESCITATESVVLEASDVGLGEEKTRGFLRIQEGCDAFCSYCIVPQARGLPWSEDADEVLSRAAALVKYGAKEIILTGTRIGAYSDKNADSLLDLLKRLLDVVGDTRVRLSSLSPLEIPTELIQLMREDSRLCPHIHLSLQSPLTEILAAMNRHYDEKQVRRCLDMLAEQGQGGCIPPGGVFVGMDVITGFPGEEPKLFEKSYRALEEMPWTRLHIFPYSEREGTKAVEMACRVPQAERIVRSRALQKLGLQRLRSSYEKVLSAYQQGQVGRSMQRAEVLMEKPFVLPDVKAVQGQRWRSAGYTSNYYRVIVDGRHDTMRNQKVAVLVQGLEEDAQAQELSLTGALEPAIL